MTKFVQKQMRFQPFQRQKLCVLCFVNTLPSSVNLRASTYEYYIDDNNNGCYVEV